MPISRVPGVGLDSGSSGVALSNLSATGTPGVTTFLRGDNTWSSTMTSGTAVTASGTSVDFTGIPAGVKRITVMFNGVSTNGTSFFLIQLGDSGGIENSGYGGSAGSGSTGNANSAGFIVSANQTAAAVYSGIATIANVSGNIWVISGTTTGSGGFVTTVFGGNKELSATLDRVRITTVNGTDTFDAGTINLLWE